MVNNNTKVVTRFAPSPTGFLHVGAYRTAIFSYLYARKNNGIFVLRIEDTDRERNKQEYEENIIESLKWLGLEYDTQYRQSERIASHKKYLEKMITEGTAYVSKEEAKDGSGKIKEIVRFKNPNIDVTFHDEIKGNVTMNTTDLGDFVIAKNIEEPLFHLAVVVDDFESGVTHVIRGEDHTSNTPRQILIQRAIGAPTPSYAHLPLVLGQDKLKLSKRRGALALTEYREQGFLPEAILNGVAFIGWNPGTDKEIFTHAELVEAFELSRVQKSPAVFNEEKLRWFNKEHMKLLSKEVLEEKMIKWLPESITQLPEYSLEKYKKLIPIIIERMSTFDDIRKMTDGGEIGYFFSLPDYSKEKLIWKGSNAEIMTENIQEIITLIKNIDSAHFNDIQSIRENISQYLADTEKGPFLHPLRVALSGKEKSPDPFTLAFVLGKEETLTRLQKAIQTLK